MADRRLKAARPLAIEHKAMLTLGGDGRHMDEVLRFVKRGFENGMRFGEIARMLSLSYDELLELMPRFRHRIRDLRLQRQRAVARAFSWN
jgi:hypothetical protein